MTPVPPTYNSLSPKIMCYRGGGFGKLSKLGELAPIQRFLRRVNKPRTHHKLADGEERSWCFGYKGII